MGRASRRLNNAQLRASLAGLGIAEADLVQATRLRNPRFSYSNIRSSDATTIDRTVMVNVILAPTVKLALLLVQVTVPLETEHPALAVLKVTPAGKVSTTVTGPL